MNFSEKQIEAYEGRINKSVALIGRVGMGLMCLTMILNLLHVLEFGTEIYLISVISVFILFFPTLFYDILKKDSIVIRHVVLTAMIVMAGLWHSYLSYPIVIMLLFPMISAMYCDRRSVVHSLAVSALVLFFSHLAGFRFGVDLKDPDISFQCLMTDEVVPEIIAILVFSVVCIWLVNMIQQLIRSVTEKNKELYKDQETLIASLSEMIEAQSQETGLHVKRVSEYTKILCRALDMNEEDVWKISTAAMMHDVGKIVIPKAIINKPGRLTAEEFDIVRQHARYGKQLLENSPGELMKISAEIAYQHHERYDGRGYYGIKGEDISLYARCVAIADVFDALASKRPYKKAWTPQEAREEIVANRGTQFDPMLVDLFQEHFSEFLNILEKYPDARESV